MTIGIGQQITDRLKQVLPKYTDDFSDILSVSSLTQSGGAITAVTAIDHNLTTGDYVLARGAKEPIVLTSLTRSGTTVTGVSSSSHKLTDPLKYALQYRPLYITISGATPADYNGTFELISVPDDTTFTFKIDTEPTSPASTAGYLLLDDYDGYNGFKQITVVDSTTFTYTTSNTALPSPAQGTIEISIAARVGHAASARRIFDFYSAAADQSLQNWIFVVVNNKTIFRDGTIISDASAAQNKGTAVWSEGIQEFSVYVVVPAKTSVLGGSIADIAMLYEKPILKAIGNYIFTSDLQEAQYQPVSYVANEEDDYIPAYYTHRFDFVFKGLIHTDDCADSSPGVPLQIIDGTISDASMVVKPTMR